MRRTRDLNDVYGIEPECMDMPRPYDRYTDEEGWVWRVETDGNGQLVTHRESFRGPDLMDMEHARLEHRGIRRRKARAKAEHPNLRRSVLALLEVADMTAKDMARVTGRRHQVITEMMSRLKDEGRVSAEYVAHSEYRWTLL